MKPIMKPLIWDLYGKIPTSLLRPLVRIRHRHIWSAIPKKNKPVLIHIPKTGGTSLAHALYGQAINHYPIQIWRLADPNRFSETLFVAVLRDPAERLVSAIRHCLGAPRASKRDVRLGDFFRSFSSNTEELLQLYLTDASVRNYCASNIMFKPFEFWLGKPANVQNLRVFKLEKGVDGRKIPNSLNVNLSNNYLSNLPKEIEEKALEVLRGDYDWYTHEVVLPVGDAIETLTQIK